ncbi:hypothetical protein F4801DRAFT_594888 [Xylaria longipes]|nr:hypothetical protein F4801DRAFT_594888 [Xylaria longipes]
MHSLDIGPKLLCCNNSNATACEKLGTLACKNCLMVTYCSKRCQIAHWRTHRTHCKSPLMMETWHPSSITAKARMSCICGSGSDDGPGMPNLWGNVPAVDVVQLGQNEGIGFREPIRVLFPASGDIRNTIFSVTSLPLSYQSLFTIVLNDPDIDIVARNLLFLWIFFVEDNAAAAAEHVLHVWYSALVTESCYSMLCGKLKPFVEQVCNKITQKSGPTLLSKTWKFGECFLRLVLTRDDWFSLLSYFDIPLGLSKDTAQRVRQSIVSAPQRITYWESVMCTKSPTGRVAMGKFCRDGLLLPFGQSRLPFTIPNPTLFHFRRGWPIMDTADPVDGWPMKSVLGFDIGPAKNDVYGKLYHYLKHLFADFHRRLRSLPVAFTLSRVDVQLLPKSLTEKQFDRIDVGNICDKAYLGINITLQTFGPLLQPVSVNPHAKLVTLFRDAVADAKNICDAISNIVDIPFKESLDVQAEKIVPYMPGLREELQDTDRWRNGIVKIARGIRLVYDMDGLFNWFVLTHGLLRFADVALNAGVEMKATHTIVDAWPMKFQGGMSTEQAKQDFALLLSSNHTGQQRYVEWKVGAERPVEDVDE